jgi:circadian clock protein KaiC
MPCARSIFLANPGFRTFFTGLDRIMDHTFTAPRASAGNPGLDAVLSGGFPRDQIYLVVGDPGAGKTTLALQFLMEGARVGESSLYVVLAETEREVRRLAASHGWDLAGVQIAQGVPRETRRDQEYSFFPSGEVELEEVLKGILALLDKHKPARVVFDSLSELRLLAQDRLRYRRQILALKDHLQQNRMTVLLLDFLSTNDDRQLETLCHGILSLEQLAPEYGGQRRRLRIRKLRESDFRDGYHDFTIKQGGIEVYPRLVAHAQAKHEYRQETCSSGIAELDQLLCGGLDRGTTTLIMGPAGAGKSTLSAQYSKAAVERGEKAALFVFDEVPDTYVVRGEGLGMDIRAHMEAGLITIQQVDPAQLSPGAFAYAVQCAVEKQGAKVIVIDSVNGYQSSMPEEHFLHAHLHELLAYLNQKRIVTILVMTQAGLLGQGVTSPVELSYLADTIILLRYFEMGSTVRQAISVIKRRTGPHERTVRSLTMSEKGLAVGDVLHEFSGVLTGRLVYTGPTEQQPLARGLRGENTDNG